MYCPKCGINNEENAVFCMNCGNSLSPASNQNPVMQSNVERPNTVFPGSTQYPPASDPAHQVPTSYQNPTQYHNPTPAQYNPQYPTQFPAPTQYQNPTPSFPLPIPDNAAIFNVWGPFAGYGTQRSHNGWLMDNKGERARELQEKIRANFNKRMIPGANAQEQELTAKGLLVEKRPYFLLSRKNISVALHISEFGKDLFVSIASYLKAPISNLRVLIVGIMAAFSLLTMIILPGAVSAQVSGLTSSFLGGGSGMGGLVTLLCVIGPLAGINSILLTLLLFYSGYKWLTEKDLFAALRSKPNEFNEDDLMAMEKTVEQTVRISIDEIGLDPDDLKPVNTGEKSRLI